MNNNTDNKFWVKIDEDFVRNSDVSVHARLLEIILRTYGDTPFIKQSTMAKLLSLSETSTRSVKNYLAELKANGRLPTWKRRGFHLSNVYAPIKVFDNPTGKYKKVTDNPSYRLHLTQLTGFDEPLNYNQLNNYKLIQCFDDDFPFDQIDDVAIDICSILDGLNDFDLEQIIRNLESLISNYWHLDMFKYIIRLRGVIDYGFKTGNRVIDPYQLLCSGLDYLDKRHYIEVITANPKPLKGESEREYETRIDALRARKCAFTEVCSLCFEHTLTNYSERFQFTYFDRSSEKIRECIQKNIGFAEKLSDDVKKHILAVMDEEIATPMCLDCVMKFYIYT